VNTVSDLIHLVKLQLFAEIAGGPVNNVR